MRAECWLAVSESGSIRLRMNKPDIENNEVAVKVNIDIPDEMFHQPHVEANISVDEESYTGNPITQEEINTIAEEIEHATGLHMNISIGI